VCVCVCAERYGKKLASRIDCLEVHWLGLLSRLTVKVLTDFDCVLADLSVLIFFSSYSRRSSGVPAATTGTQTGQKANPWVSSSR
jgi:hypothetical protein